MPKRLATHDDLIAVRSRLKAIESRVGKLEKSMARVCAQWNDQADDINATLIKFCDRIADIEYEVMPPGRRERGRPLYMQLGDMFSLYESSRDRVANLERQASTIKRPQRKAAPKRRAKKKSR